MTRFQPRKILTLTILSLVLLAIPASASAQPDHRGFQLHSLWYERSMPEMQRELDLVAETGANTVRVDVGWSSLESGGKGQLTGWYLDKLDSFMEGASARGLKVIATVAETPCWASSAPETLKQSCAGAWWSRGVQLYPPRDYGDYAEAVKFIVARYSGRLAALEVWNEPNTERFLIADDKASAYAMLVKAAYPASKAADPSVPVLAGALAAADRPFLDALYARGIAGYYDGISVHPYNEWRDPYDRWQDQWKKYTFLPGMEWVHEGQEKAGDKTPLWITEFGWTTCVGHEWCVNESQQADYLVKGWQILNALDYVEGATAYELRDGSNDRGDFESNWGLVHTDFNQKPAFGAVKAELQAPSEGTLVTVEIKVEDGGKVFAVGHAPRHRPLSVQVTGCRRQDELKRRRWIRVNRRGAYVRRLGRVSGLRGCRVAVREPSARLAAVSRVPAKGRIALHEARSIG